MSLNFVNIVLAEAAATPAMREDPRAQMGSTIGLVVIMAIAMYFLMIRPQSKKAKEHVELLKGIKAGDKVVTSGGVVGTVVSVKEKTVALRSAETKIEVLKTAVTDVTERASDSGGAES